MIFSEIINRARLLKAETLFKQPVLTSQAQYGIIKNFAPLEHAAVQRLRISKDILESFKIDWPK